MRRGVHVGLLAGLLLLLRLSLFLMLRAVPGRFSWHLLACTGRASYVHLSLV